MKFIIRDMLFPTKLTSLINTLGLIDSASLENHQNNRRNSGTHKWPKTFLGGVPSNGNHYCCYGNETKVAEVLIRERRWPVSYIVYSVMVDDWHVSSRFIYASEQITKLKNMSQRIYEIIFICSTFDKSHNVTVCAISQWIGKSHTFWP